MKVQFLAPRSIDGVLYSKGVHEIPDSMKDHWYLKGIVESGHAKVLEGPKIVRLTPEELAQHQSPPNTPPVHEADVKTAHVNGNVKAVQQPAVTPIVPPAVKNAAAAPKPAKAEGAKKAAAAVKTEVKPVNMKMTEPKTVAKPAETTTLN